MGKQMTASAGAPIDDAKKWASIEFDKARHEVRRLHSCCESRNSTYRKGCEFEEMEQGQSPSVHAHTLVLRQGPGCEASDLEQREENPWC